MAFQTRMSDTLFKKRTDHDSYRRCFGLVLNTNKDASDKSKMFDIDWFLIVWCMNGSQPVIWTI